MLQDVEDVKAASSGSARIDKEDAGGGRFKRTKFNQPDTTASIDAIERSDAGLGEEASQTTLLHSNTVTLVTQILPLLAKIRPSDVDDKVQDLARMRFEYAGVADMASRTLDEHETGVIAEDENEEEQQIKDKQGSKRKQASTRGQSGEEEDEEKLILSDDDIGDF